MKNISNIPVAIIQGIHAEITLHSWAKNFSSKFNNVRLIEVDAGHSPNELEMKSKLIESINEMIK